MTPPDINASALGGIPFANVTVTLSQEALIQLRWEARYWRALHAQAVERIKALEAEVQALRAEVRELKARLYNRKSERSQPAPATGKPGVSGRSRGQQPGATGHGRRDYSHLPAQEEIHALPETERVCPCCGLPFEAFPGTEDSEVIEIEVKAHRRVIRRRRYKRCCQCKGAPKIVTAPVLPKLIPKGHLGVSIWVAVLLDKYHSLRPTTRLLRDWETYQLAIPLGTITDGLRKLLPLLWPIYEALIQKNQTEKRWHADETRWLVFASQEGKVGHHWYMWVFGSPSAVVYRLDPSRSAKAPKAHFGILKEGILTVDRYTAYKAMVKVNGIILSFCWAHVRRDFMKVITGWKQEHEAWAEAWIRQIGHLYTLNAQRLAFVDQPQAFAEKDRVLRAAVQAMAYTRDAELAALPKKSFADPRGKVLESLKRHWEGLTVFLDHPEVPMDNNEAERLERTPAVARKNFYGSCALWSGQLAAVMFSIFQTLAQFGLNPRVWLTAYFEACAVNHGQAPDDIQPFMPWKLSTEQRNRWALHQSDVNDTS